MDSAVDNSFVALPFANRVKTSCEERTLISPALVGILYTPVFIAKRFALGSNPFVEITVLYPLILACVKALRVHCPLVCQAITGVLRSLQFISL